MFPTLTGSFLKVLVPLIHIIKFVPFYLHLKINIWRKDNFGVVLTNLVRQLIMISILCFKIKKKSKISSHQKGQKGWAYQECSVPVSSSHIAVPLSPRHLLLSLDCWVEVWRLVREKWLERWWRRAKEKGMSHVECSLGTRAPFLMSHFIFTDIVKSALWFFSHYRWGNWNSSNSWG